MNKLATLGPKGTYSESAALKYIRSNNEAYEIEYFTSIKKALNAVGDDCDLAVLPIENFSEGFVSLVLDHIIESDLSIVSEIILPIQFSFVTKERDVSNINRLFVQFVAKGQCSEYLETLGNIDIISTESNIESLNMVVNDPDNSSAIVPSGSFNLDEFNTVVENVNDYKNNQTRFLALSKIPRKIDTGISSNWKTSLVILDDHDRPGLLAGILTCFASRNINLTSIISRPTKVKFGRYNFLIDVNGHSEDGFVSEAIKEISLIAKVKNMGSYPAAEIV
ncbi:MAG: ACT domain-containing protein [Pseudomonadales bacterium]|nr:ACT domain-containing protein [Pseudomonadales bacterium]